MRRLPAVGEDFAGYRLEEQLGAGAAGAVYRVRNPRLHRAEAMKVLIPPRAPGAAARWRRRLRAEISCAATLTAPNTVALFDAGAERGLGWYTMRLVAGVSLRDELAATPPRAHPAHEVIGVVHDIAGCLDAMAAARPALVHGDVTPGNIMIRRSGGVFESAVLIDFGVAVLAEVAARGAGRRIAGTVPYLAPEVLEHGRQTAAGDVFGLGCVAYEMIRGHRAFPPREIPAAARARRRRPPPAGRGPAVDRALRRALDPDPARRPVRAGLFAEELTTAIIGGAGGWIPNWG